MDETKKLMLQCILLATEKMKDNLDYTYKPEYLKVYCECIEILAKTYKMIENKQEENTNESN